MSRFKYRAWDKIDKRMIKVYRIHVGESGELVSVVDHFGVVYNSDDVELMQSSGVEDKNGVEIFEGDVVKLRDCFHAKVYFSKKHASFMFENNYNNWFMWHEFHYPHLIEVAGNIFKDRHLLEE